MLKHVAITLALLVIGVVFVTRWKPQPASGRFGDLLGHEIETAQLALPEEQQALIRQLKTEFPDDGNRFFFARELRSTSDSESTFGPLVLHCEIGAGLDAARDVNRRLRAIGETALPSDASVRFLVPTFDGFLRPLSPQELNL